MNSGRKRPDKECHGQVCFGFSMVRIPGKVLLENEMKISEIMELEIKL